MNEIILIRPCKTKVDGDTGSVRFTSKGRGRMDRLVERVRDLEIERIVSGPEESVALTAHSLARALDIDRLEIDGRLREHRMPSDEEMARDAVLKLSFEDEAWAPDGGESLREARSRAIECLRSVRGEDGSVVAVVCAPVLLVQVLRYFDGRAGIDAYHALTRPDVYRVRFGDDDFTIERLWKGTKRTAWLKRPPQDTKSSK